MIPRELDRIVMKALAMDPQDRYQSAADMAAEIERTMIAARYSSRELSKMLHELYLAGDDPLIVVDASDGKDALEHTIAITSTGTPPPAEHDARPPAATARAEREETRTAHGRRGARRALTPGAEALGRAAEGHGHRAASRPSRSALSPKRPRNTSPDLLRRPPPPRRRRSSRTRRRPRRAPAAKPNAVPARRRRSASRARHKTKGHGPHAERRRDDGEAGRDAPMPPSTE